MERFKNILLIVDNEAKSEGAIRAGVQLAKHNDAKLKLVDVFRERNWLERMTAPNAKEAGDKIHADKQQRLDSIAETVKDVDVSTKLLKGKASIEIVREVIRDDHDLVIKEAKGATWFKGFFGRTAIQLLRQCPCHVWLTKPGPHQDYERVLAAIDAASSDEAHAQLSHKILDVATSFCRRENAHLDIVQAWTVYGESLLRCHMQTEEFEDLVRSTREEVEQRVNSLLTKYGTHAGAAGVHVLSGDPGYVIPELAKQSEIDLIVMGTVARTGISGALMGNSAETILGRVQCSVLALKPDGFVSPIKLED